MSSKASDTVVSIEHLAFSYGNRRVLADICLEADRGEIVGIVGRSGGGKSTILNIAAGVLSPESGKVVVGGVTPRSARALQRIGYLFQAPNLLPWLTTRENVGLPFRLRQRNILSKSDETVQWILDKVHLADASEKYPHELSGGMQTRVAMARALVYQPDLLLMDEPFSSLDDLVKESLYEEFQEVVLNTQMASLLVTHNLSEAVLLCDRVYILCADSLDGPSRIVHCEPIPFDRPRHPKLLSDTLFTLVRKRVREALK